MNLNTELTFIPIHDSASCDVARVLIRDYAETALAEHYALFAEDIEDEMTRLPHPYVAPKGKFLIAYIGDEPCGTIALRPLFEEGTGEIMRMYVHPQHRGKGIAEQLMRTIMQCAQQMGYHTLYLTSLHKFAHAHALYEKMGFSYVSPYSETMPEHIVQQAHFMMLRCS